MRPEKLILDQKATIQFSQTITQKFRNTENKHVARDISEESIGGFIRNGQFGWIAYGPHIEVFSVKSGNKVASYSFDNTHRISNTLITCVSEVNVIGINSSILMIGVQCTPIGGSLYLFSVQGSRLLHRIDVIDRITSCCFVSTATCQRSCLTKFDGCVAIGTDQGKVFLMDLNLRKCKEVILGKHVYNPESDSTTCQIVLANMDFKEIIGRHRQSQKDKLNFGIQLEVLPKAGPILSILSLTPLVTVAVGLEDGQMLLYDLEDLQAYHLAYPPENDSPLVKLTYIEPTDDPRACVYIWAFHANADIAIAVMHSISFESKTIQDDIYIYETFQSCSPRLTIPICEKGSVPVACQSISKVVSDEEDEILSLCLLAWTTKTESFMMIFDLNQWYKEQMPHVCDWTEYPSYLAPFPLPHNEIPLDVWLNPKTVATFNSTQRPEEHFYPTSLSFDCVKLTVTGTSNFHWAGLQNKALEKLSSFGAVVILEPDECFTDILEACLIPQFSDQNYHSNPTMRLKQEFLLSMALQYNCMGILKECAKLWADGSHMGNLASESLSLSILTDWIWAQATVIKDCCNNLCVPLFDYSGCSIDLRSRKILGHCSRQLKLLADLLHMIVTQCRQNIPDEIFDTLCCQRNSIRMTSEYQEVLQWLLNMGLLPEVAWGQFTRHNSQLSLAYTPDTSIEVFSPVPYPYRILNEYYTAQRQRFYEIDRNLLMPKTNSCRCLFIDMFIEKECNSHQLRSEWKNNTGDSFYPPPSLQAMLRILLIPGISLENKYMLFVYLFLDLNMALEDERYYRVVQNLIKFPAVFKLNPYLIKTAQAFWNLDHKEFETALDELISPLTNDRYISQWQQELLINSLLIQDMPHLALRAVRAPGPPISAVIEIKTLLANSLITEAFELQRFKCDDDLLLEFYKGCHALKKWNYVLGLVLTEREGQVLTKFLQSSGTLLTENLQLLYLLQRNKSIEAINYLDEIKRTYRPRSLQQKLENTQDLIFSSYKLAMAPNEKEITDMYISIRDRIPKRDEKIVDGTKPLSAVLNKQLMENELNVVGGIFHRAVLNAKATVHPSIGIDANENYVPFLSKPQIDFDFFENNNHNPVSYPKTYVPSGKRRKEAIYDQRDAAEGNQPAAKRQRTDSFSLADRPSKRTMEASVLTSFKVKHLEKSKGKFDQSLSTSSRESPVHKPSADESVNLLSTPVVKNMRSDKRLSSRSERARTPQSILKNRHIDHGSIASRRSPSPTFTAGSARRSVDFDERSFRFNMQNTSIDSADDYRLRAIPESIADDESSSDQVKVSYPSIQARSGIHSTNTSLLSISTDEYFSPETSKLSDKPIIRTVEEMESETEDDKVSKASREEQSTTPEKRRTPIKRQTRSHSAAPEVSTPPLSRVMTRSKSKQQLNETADSSGGESDQRNEPETSTPLQSIRGRASLRSFKSLTKPLSKTVIESNAIKVLIERSKASKSALAVDEIEQQKHIDSMDTSVLSASSDSSRTHTEKRTKNILEDNSYVSDSLLKRYRNELDSTIGSDNSSFGTTNIRPRPNILHDSSSMETTKWEKESSTANTSQSTDETSSTDQAKQDTISINREYESMSEGNDDITESMKSIGEEAAVEEEEAQSASLESEKSSPSKTLPEIIVSDEEVENQTAAASSETGVSDQDFEYTDSPNNEANQCRGNILSDDSKVRDTFLKRYNEEINTTVYSETSTIFTRAKNILDDSSPGPHTSSSSKLIDVEIKEKITKQDEDQLSVVTHQEIEINVREESQQVESEEENKETAGGSSRKLIYQSESESIVQLDFNDVIEAEIEEISDVIRDSDSDIEEAETDGSSKDKSSSSKNNQSNNALNVSDIINISSSSEESNTVSKKDSHTIDLTQSKSREDVRDRVAPIPDFAIDDLFTAHMDDEVQRPNVDDVVSTKILNEMIYGDLQIDEPADMSNNENIYLNMDLASSIGRNQRNDEEVNRAFSTNENIYQLDVGTTSSTAQPIPSSDNVILINQPSASDTVNPANAVTGLESTQDLHNVAAIEITDVSIVQPTEDRSEIKTDVEQQQHEISNIESNIPSAEAENKTDFLNEGMVAEPTDVGESGLATNTVTSVEAVDVLNQGMVVDPSLIEDTDSISNITTPVQTTDNTNVLNEGMVIDSTKSEENKSSTEAPKAKKVESEKAKEDTTRSASTKLTRNLKVNAIDEENNQPSTSQAALAKYKLAESATEITETPRLPVKRLRTNSLSVKTSTSDNEEGIKRSTRAKSVTVDNQSEKEKTVKRSTRAKSVTTDDDKAQVPVVRSHKSASKLDTKSGSKSTESSSTQPLDTISESPKRSIRSTRKKTTSESSDAIKSSLESEANRTPKRNRRKRESDTESMVSTSSRRSVERDVVATPTTRSRRRTEQDAPDSDSKLETPSRKRARSSKKDDDAMSETSSIASSTRSHDRVKQAPEDDDKSSVKSAKSKKSVKVNLTPATLPIIKEDEPTVAYETSSRRLTRAQKATMQKYLTDKRKYESNLESTSSRIMTRRQSASQSVTESPGDNDESDSSDAGSVASNVTRLSKTSKASKASKASNTSNVSKASRTTKASDTSRASRSSKRIQSKKAS